MPGPLPPEKSFTVFRHEGPFQNMHRTRGFNRSFITPRLEHCGQRFSLHEACAQRAIREFRGAMTQRSESWLAAAGHKLTVF